MTITSGQSKEKIGFEDLKKIVLDDYRIANESRQTSLLGRREVLTGKAKFGIFGDGKEIPQLAMAKVFKPGDFRSGYYRDQTFMFAIGTLTIEQWFAGLYAHTDLLFEPTSGGRQMGGHYATPLLNPNGHWKNLVTLKNSSADVSPTASQMPRLLGLAYASYFYRHNPQLQRGEFLKFSNHGNEIAFGTIGDASTSEGLFWETLNAAGVLQIPMIISVWDDGYGISVPKKYQTIKQSIYEALKGFQRTASTPGFEILYTKGWDYVHLIETYEKAEYIARYEHIPVLIHVDELTQPQGHSTSGSHERYKSKERLEWEAEFDGIRKMREWILSSGIAIEHELNTIEEKSKQRVLEARNKAWQNYLTPILNERNQVADYLDKLSETSAYKNELQTLKNELLSIKEPVRKDIHQIVKKALRLTKRETSELRSTLSMWLIEKTKEAKEIYGSHLYSETEWSALKVKPVPPTYSDNSPLVDARILLRDNFDAILSKYPEVIIFGEDSGRIGDVNQGLEKLQAKYGELRVFDTGIREATIIGQAIGLSMRGLRPIAEIQYLDYLLYALQIMSDDLATVRWRSKGTQKAPVIIRTRGHRLEGVWHSGSPMGTIINACRGIYICVPRNATQAAGFYNTLLQSDDTALIIEPLNAYRLKEKLPDNIGEFKIPLGIPEILNEGSDVTLVTYGSCVRIAQEAITWLQEHQISVELIDVQTLIPFDIQHRIVESIKKTNRLAILDEDVPGGASAYILKKILEDQNAYQYLDSAPITITAKEHRPAYATDGDYFSKPSADDVFDAIYSIMHEANPNAYPKIY